MGQGDRSPDEQLLSEHLTDAELHDLLIRLTEAFLGGSEQSTVCDVVEATGVPVSEIAGHLGELRREEFERRFREALEKHVRDLELSDASQGPDLIAYLTATRIPDAGGALTPSVRRSGSATRGENEELAASKMTALERLYSHLAQLRAEQYIEFPDMPRGSNNEHSRRDPAGIIRKSERQKSGLG